MPPGESGVRMECGRGQIMYFPERFLSSVLPLYLYHCYICVTVIFVSALELTLFSSMNTGKQYANILLLLVDL